jgi:type IV secretory pathway TrbF-like protein
MLFNALHAGMATRPKQYFSESFRKLSAVTVAAIAAGRGIYQYLFRPAVVFVDGSGTASAALAML